MISFLDDCDFKSGQNPGFEISKSMLFEHRTREFKLSSLTSTLLLGCFVSRDKGAWLNASKSRDLCSKSTGSVIVFHGNREMKSRARSRSEITNRCFCPTTVTKYTRSVKKIRWIFKFRGLCTFDFRFFFPMLAHLSRMYVHSFSNIAFFFVYERHKG